MFNSTKPPPKKPGLQNRTESSLQPSDPHTVEQARRLIEKLDALMGAEFCFEGKSEETIKFLSHYLNHIAQNPELVPPKKLQCIFTNTFKFLLNNAQNSDASDALKEAFQNFYFGVKPYANFQIDIALCILAEKTFRQERAINQAMYDDAVLYLEKCTTFEARDQKNSDVVYHFHIDFRKLVGQGGFGNVFSATRRRYDVKNQKWVTDISEPFVAKFVKTEKSTVEEENFISMLSPRSAFAALKSFKVYFMPFLHGNLAMLKEFPNLKLRDTIEIISGLLVDTERLHANGWIHRDLKPENIACHVESDTNKAYRKTFQVSILDGGSMIRANSTGCVETKGTMCTPLYMAPEIFEHIDTNKMFTFSFKTDVYALAAVMGCLLLREHIFQHKRNITRNRNVRRQHTRALSQQPFFISDNPFRFEIAPIIAIPLKEILKKAGDQNPNERPTVAELREFFFALRNYLVLEEEKKTDETSYANGVTKAKSALSKTYIEEQMSECIRKMYDLARLTLPSEESSSHLMHSLQPTVTSASLKHENNTLRKKAFRKLVKYGLTGYGFLLKKTPILRYTDTIAFEIVNICKVPNKKTKENLKRFLESSRIILQASWILKNNRLNDKRYDAILFGEIEKYIDFENGAENLTDITYYTREQILRFAKSIIELKEKGILTKRQIDKHFARALQSAPVQVQDKMTPEVLPTSLSLEAYLSMNRFQRWRNRKKVVSNYSSDELADFILNHADKIKKIFDISELRDKLALKDLDYLLKSKSLSESHKNFMVSLIAENTVYLKKLLENKHTGEIPEALLNIYYEKILKLPRKSCSFYDVRFQESYSRVLQLCEQPSIVTNFDAYLTIVQVQILEKLNNHDASAPYFLEKNWHPYGNDGCFKIQIKKSNEPVGHIKVWLNLKTPYWEIELADAKKSSSNKKSLETLYVDYAGLFRSGNQGDDKLTTVFKLKQTALRNEPTLLKVNPSTPRFCMSMPR